MTYRRCRRQATPPPGWEHDPTGATEEESETVRAVAAELVRTLTEALNLLETCLALSFARAAIAHAMTQDGLPVPESLVIDPDTGKENRL